MPLPAGPWPRAAGVRLRPRAAGCRVRAVPGQHTRGCRSGGRTWGLTAAQPTGSLFLQGSGTVAPWLEHPTAWAWDPCPSYGDPQFQATCCVVAILTAHPRDLPTPLTLGSWPKVHGEAAPATSWTEGNGGRVASWPRLARSIPVLKSSESCSFLWLSSPVLGSAAQWTRSPAGGSAAALRAAVRRAAVGGWGAQKGWEAQTPRFMGGDGDSLTTDPRNRAFPWLQNPVNLPSGTGCREGALPYVGTELQQAWPGDPVLGELLSQGDPMALRLPCCTERTHVGRWPAGPRCSGPRAELPDALPHIWQLSGAVCMCKPAEPPEGARVTVS